VFRGRVRELLGDPLAELAPIGSAAQLHGQLVADDAVQLDEDGTVQIGIHTAGHGTRAEGGAPPLGFALARPVEVLGEQVAEDRAAWVCN
jgi:hypothetical protein